MPPYSSLRLRLRESDLGSAVLLRQSLLLPPSSRLRLRLRESDLGSSEPVACLILRLVLRLFLLCSVLSSAAFTVALLLPAVLLLPGEGTARQGNNNPNSRRSWLLGRERETGTGQTHAPSVLHPPRIVVAGWHPFPCQLRSPSGGGLQLYQGKVGTRRGR